MFKNMTIGDYIIGVLVVRVHDNIMEVYKKQVGILPD